MHFILSKHFVLYSHDLNLTKKLYYTGWASHCLVFICLQYKLKLKYGSIFFNLIFNDRNKIQ